MNFGKFLRVYQGLESSRLNEGSDYQGDPTYNASLTPLQRAASADPTTFGFGQTGQVVAQLLQQLPNAPANFDWQAAAKAVSPYAGNGGKAGQAGWGQTSNPADIYNAIVKANPQLGGQPIAPTDPRYAQGAQIGQQTSQGIDTWKAANPGKGFGEMVKDFVTNPGILMVMTMGAGAALGVGAAAAGGMGMADEAAGLGMGVGTIGGGTGISTAAGLDTAAMNLGAGVGTAGDAAAAGSTFEPLGDAATVGNAGASLTSPAQYASGYGANTLTDVPVQDIGPGDPGYQPTGGVDGAPAGSGGTAAGTGAAGSGATATGSGAATGGGAAGPGLTQPPLSLSSVVNGLKTVGGIASTLSGIAGAVGTLTGSGNSPVTASNAAGTAAATAGADQQAHADQLFNFYQQNYQPLEQQAIADATAAGSPGMQDSRASQAGNTVGTAYDNAQKATLLSRAQMGIRPDSGSTEAMQNQSDIAKAGAVAGAANTARQDERVYGLNAKTSVAALGRNLAPTAVSADAGATNAASVASNIAGQGQSISNTQNSNVGNAMGALGTGADSLSKLYTNITAAQQANANSTAGTVPTSQATDNVQGDYAGYYDGMPSYYAKGGKVSLKRPPHPEVRPHPTAGYLAGGAVRGPGTGTSDSIPVDIEGKPGALGNGEYVLNAAATRKHGLKKLDRMNMAGLPKGAKMKDGMHLATGGKVTSKEFDADEGDDDDDADEPDLQYARGGMVKSLPRPGRSKGLSQPSLF